MKKIGSILLALLLVLSIGLSACTTAGTPVAPNPTKPAPSAEPRPSESAPASTEAPTPTDTPTAKPT